MSVGGASEPILNRSAAAHGFRAYLLVLGALLEPLDRRSWTHHVAQLKAKFVRIKFHILVARRKYQILERRFFKIDDLTNRLRQLERHSPVGSHSRKCELKRWNVSLRRIASRLDSDCG